MSLTKARRLLSARCCAGATLPWRQPMQRSRCRVRAFLGGSARPIFATDSTVRFDHRSLPLGTAAFGMQANARGQAPSLEEGVPIRVKSSA
jgi:hypothetical protein